MSIHCFDEGLKENIRKSNYDFEVIDEVSESIKERFVFLYCLADEYRGTEHESFIKEQLDHTLDMSQYVSNAMMICKLRNVKEVFANA